MLWHFSPASGSPGACTAQSPVTCPFRAFVHDEDIEVVQRFADVENARFFALNRFQQGYFETDWGLSSDVPQVLCSHSEVAQLRVSSETFKYLGITGLAWDRVTGCDRAFVFPKSKRAVQGFLSDPVRFNRVFEVLQRAFDDGSYRGLVARAGRSGRCRFREGGLPYDKWALAPFVDFGSRTGSVQMDGKVPLVGPDGVEGYSLSDVWRDYCLVKADKGELYESEKFPSTFYVLGFDFKK